MRRESTAGIAAFSGRDMPSASTMLAMVDAVPMVMQLPRERCMQASASVNSAWLSVPARTISDISITPVPEPTGLPRQLPDSDGPAGQADGGQVDAGRAHQQRRGGLVAAHQQHHAVDGIGADRFLHIHAGEVAEQHRRGPHLGLTQRHHRKFQRKAAGFIHAALDVLGEVAE